MTLIKQALSDIVWARSWILLTLLIFSLLTFTLPDASPSKQLTFLAYYIPAAVVLGTYAAFIHATAPKTAAFPLKQDFLGQRRRVPVISCAEHGSFFIVKLNRKHKQTFPDHVQMIQWVRIHNAQHKEHKH